MRRILASADVHRRLNDPTLFEKALSSILHDAVMTVLDAQSTNVTFDMEAVRLSFDQMSIITMLVIELANNSRKHVFQRNLGRHFAVSPRTLPDGQALFSARDDGPGWALDNSGGTERTLGQTIPRGLVDQPGGRISVKSERGTEVNVVFPILNHAQSLATGHDQESVPVSDTA